MEENHLPIISTFGLDEGVASRVEHCGLKVRVEHWDCHQDVIAHYADLTVVDPANLDEADISVLAEFWREIDPTSEREISLGAHPAFDGISTVDVVDPADERAIEVAILSTLKETKRDVDFSRKIMLVVKILHLISVHPGITTRQLAEETEQSARTVKRYIRSIQAAGILVEYSDRGWRCPEDPEVLPWAL